MSTVNLPKTSFSMRANAIEREQELQEFWKQKQVYERLGKSNPKEIFVLHDGPGRLHMGHALNKILKDIINKYKLLQGHKVNYVPGWDCHGLPIELKVLKNVKERLTPIELRKKAAEFAIETQREQAEQFKRLGIWANWDKPYLTLQPEYEAAQMEVFGRMALKGYIYRDLKPVHWSPSSRTALAEAELEYPEEHRSPSIYVAFNVSRTSKLKEFMPNLALAIWTTTPWTIAGNLAIAINNDLNYAVVEAKAGKYLVIAEDLVESLSNKLGVNLSIKTVIRGNELEGCHYEHPLFKRESPVVIGGDYISTESGTGLVHTAPGHGQEDYITGKKYNLPIYSVVDAAGRFTAEVGEFAGLQVVAKGNEKISQGNEAIIDALSRENALLKQEEYAHKYPYDWRTKKPTISRATEQWFASVDGFRDEALKSIDQVQWIPEQGKNRITPMVSERSDWCISRQRNWGVPIPVFYDEETNEALLNEDTINHVKTIICEHGSNAWWELSVEELLPKSYHNNGKTYRKGTDTMDVWFDSGSSWAAVEGLKYPADLYLEGSDQHRGWFQSSLLTSVAVNNHAPYKTVLTHGFVLDEKGIKMSKSIGNVVEPELIINGGNDKKQQPAYGADVLRLWVASTDYFGDVRIGDNIIKQVADVYRKIRNTARFLIGNLHDFNPITDAIAYDDLPELDKYILHKSNEVFSEITEAFESYQFYKFFQKVQNFCVVDLSNFYLDIAKDRLYISSVNSIRRRSCQTVMKIILENLAKSIAPVLCHMAEDIWQNLPYKKPTDSIFESGWVKLKPNYVQTAEWETLRNIRTETNKVLDRARNGKLIGSSLEAKILIYDKDKLVNYHTLKLRL